MTVVPLAAKRLLERVSVRPWKSYNHTCIVVLMDGGGRDRDDDAPVFHCL